MLGKNDSQLVLFLLIFFSYLLEIHVSSAVNLIYVSITKPYASASSIKT